ncbi:TPA: hypothetical protein U1B12_002008 [Streptococcus suis]|nr:hypothetical protein [Streptococcus suis]MCO8199375.1 hypothetical protein [Streptococcus suis]MCO8217069.1 hypothetical protein [Streptococcus suis]HEM3468823.1 hypothetical protein [Streptococcus suis]HEM3479572.1 hypothetical protein [Streptococcus suis]
MTEKLVANWEKKNRQLSELVKDSLVGLDVWETILALGKIRQMERA